MSIPTKEIRRMLANMGMMPHLCGFEYCAEAIAMTVDNPAISRQTTKVLYPELAAKFDTTAGSIERGIRNAIKRLYDMSSCEQIEMYTRVPVEAPKPAPTNTCFIAAMASYIRDECEEVNA